MAALEMDHSVFGQLRLVRNPIMSRAYLVPKIIHHLLMILDEEAWK